MPSYGLLSEAVIAAADIFMQNVENDPELEEISNSLAATSELNSWQRHLREMLDAVGKLTDPVQPNEVNDTDRKKALRDAVRKANEILRAFHDFEDDPAHQKDVEDYTPVYSSLKKAADAALQVFALRDMLDPLVGQKTSAAEANAAVSKADEDFKVAQKTLADNVKIVNALKETEGMKKIDWTAVPNQNIYANGIPHAELLAGQENIYLDFSNIQGVYSTDIETLQRIEVDESNKSRIAKEKLDSDLEKVKEENRKKIDGLNINLDMNKTGSKEGLQILAEIAAFNQKFQPETNHDADLRFGLGNEKKWQTADRETLNKVQKEVDTLLESVDQERQRINRAEKNRDARVKELQAEAKQIRKDADEYAAVSKLSLYDHVPTEKELPGLAFTREEAAALETMKDYREEFKTLSDKYAKALQKCEKLAAAFESSIVKCEGIVRDGRWENTVDAFKNGRFYKRGTISNLLHSISVLTDQKVSGKYEQMIEEKINASGTKEEMRDALRNELDRYHELRDCIKNELKGVSRVQDLEGLFDYAYMPIRERFDRYAKEADSKDKECRNLLNKDFSKDKAELQRKEDYLKAVKKISAKIQDNRKSYELAQKVLKIQNEIESVKRATQKAETDCNEGKKNIDLEEKKLKDNIRRKSQKLAEQRDIIGDHSVKFRALEDAVKDLKTAGAEVNAREQAAEDANNAENRFVRQSCEKYVLAIELRTAMLLSNLKAAKKKHFSDTTEFTDMVKAVENYRGALTKYDMTAQELKTASDTAMAAVNTYIYEKTKDDPAKLKRSTGAGNKRMAAAMKLMDLLLTAPKGLEKLEKVKVSPAQKSAASVQNMYEYRILKKAEISINGMNDEQKISDLEKTEKKLIAGREKKAEIKPEPDKKNAAEKAVKKTEVRQIVK